ncbi:mitochondrial assembly of ribosomal large subunit protein 1-like isoform X2 [Convolutriloba macropyga]|uniref:mitochondrial assembly of ribosomal large subunit protein 1-like isoform X2 n=1 Tax=Convolutriloba macropyga TaxID=536237 RepID=UPI003F5215A3
MIFQCFKLSSLLNIESQRILRRVSSANFVHSVAGLLCRPTEEFNLSRAIDFLTQSKVRDVCVIQKKSLKDDDKCSVSAAADIIVIGSGVSQRHLNRIGEGILKEYKTVVGSNYLQYNRPPRIEGMKKKSSWISCDFGKFLEFQTFFMETLSSI